METQLGRSDGEPVIFPLQPDDVGELVSHFTALLWQNITVITL